jgi:hypothetical protein
MPDDKKLRGKMTIHISPDNIVSLSQKTMCYTNS